MNSSYFRMATIEDYREILNIYEPYIYNTAITFDYDTFTKEEFQSKIEKISKQFPYIVCVIDDEIVGYAYCTPYLEKEGFSWDCEITIYIKEGYHRKGIASNLYDMLLKLVKAQGYYNVYSLICIPNDESVALHKKFGFTEVGIYKKTAFKLNQWQDLLVLEKTLIEHSTSPLKPRKITEVEQSYIKNVLEEGTRKLNSHLRNI